MTSTLLPYDALLFVSFGGPDGPDDVLPFLENVTRGRGVPRERLEEVAEHYHHFGGKSPINEQNLALIAAVEAELARRGLNLPVVFGNRNWHPLLPDALRQLKSRQARRVLAFFTSAYSSYSGCRQYRENLAAAQGEAETDFTFEKLRVFYNHPGFIEPQAESLARAWSAIPQAERNQARVLFTAHSIPTSMANGCRYTQQLKEACRLVSAGAELPAEVGELVYQSRSGSPRTPWLEPDVCDRLRQLAGEGVRHVVISPIGFVSDHLEVLFDLDTEAAELCTELGISMQRVPTVGTDPRFVSMIVELIEERCRPELPRRSLGVQGVSHDLCPANCCLSGAPGPRRPAVSQAGS